MSWKALATALAALVGVCAFSLLAAPAKIDALAWRPGVAPALALNSKLDAATEFASGKVHGPEDIAIRADGRIYSGLENGDIVQILPDRVERVMNTGGRVAGLKFAPDGTLWLCDTMKGLQRLRFKDQTNQVERFETVLTEVGGKRLNVTDDLDIAADGKIYFTDASTKFPIPDFRLDGLEGRAHGRLLEYDPATQKSRELAAGLYFANGVALSAAGDALFVAETFRYRISRYWLSGPKAGSLEVFVDNLPGFPDNVNTDGKGTLWVAYPSPRKADLDGTAAYPWLRNLIAKLPERLLPQPTRMGFIASYSQTTGAQTGLYFDPNGKRFNAITSVMPGAGGVWLGSLTHDRVGFLKLP